MKEFLKRHYKKIIIVAVILAVAYFLINKFVFSKQNSENKITKQELTEISKKEFVKSVNESGTAESADYSNIYAENQLPVKEIAVEVGDVVKAGDLIATLDSGMINKQIEQKQAMIAATNKSTKSQISTSTSRLEIAKKNDAEGTNPQIVAAENALKSAFDAWQTAEQNYSLYLRSIEQGYNEQILADLNSRNQLENSLSSANLNERQAQERLQKADEGIRKNANFANESERIFEDLKFRDKILDEKIAEIQNKLAPKDSADETILNQQLSLATDELFKYTHRLSLVENKIEEIKNSSMSDSDKNLKLEELNTSKADIELNIKSVEKEIEDLNEKIKSEEKPNSVVEIATLEEDLKKLQAESKELKEKITEISADKQKFAAEAQTYDKSIDGNFQEVEQTRLQREIGEKNMMNQEFQSEASKKSIEDNVDKLRKQADDLKNQYDASKKNLEIAKISAKDEIKSMESDLNAAKSAGDNSINYVDLKFLKEDLAKTKIVAPIDGTITEVNMIKGQVPQNYVAKIETVNQIIVKSKVKEFDVNSVKIGMPVEVTADSLGEKTIEGTIRNINPTSQTKNSASGNEVSYAVEIELKNPAKEIKPGMNVRVKYILEKMESAICVPKNAIYSKGDKNFVLAIKNEKVTTVEEIEVSIKSENDIETVIESQKLNENYLVINSPEEYSAGMEVEVEDSDMSAGK